MSEQNIPTSEVLNRAADLIEERGWTVGQGWVRVGDPADAALCLEGGIMAALGMSIPIDHQDTDFAPLLACPAYRAVTNYLDREPAYVGDHGFEGNPLYHWNDDADRTAAEVIEVLRATAVIEAARENPAAAPTRALTTEAGL